MSVREKVRMLGEATKKDQACQRIELLNDIFGKICHLPTICLYLCVCGVAVGMSWITFIHAFFSVCGK